LEETNLDSHTMLFDRIFIYFVSLFLFISLEFSMCDFRYIVARLKFVPYWFLVALVIALVVKFVIFNRLVYRLP